MSTPKELTPPDQPRWVKFHVDGGTFMAKDKRDRSSRKTRGVYWSMLCEDPAEAKDHMIRKQSYDYFTNNDAEWLGVKEALEYAVKHYEGSKIVAIAIYSDSLLVVNQFNEEWKVHLARHHRLRSACKALAERLRFVSLTWVPREVSVQKLGH